MTAQQEAPIGQPVRHLFPAAKGVLVAWAVVVLAMAVVAFIQTQGGDGMADLARFAALFLAAIALAGIGLTAFLVRQFVTNQVGQTLAALLAPPAIAVMSVMVIRLMG